MSTQELSRFLDSSIVRLKRILDARVKKYQFRGLYIKICSVAAIYTNSGLYLKWTFCTDSSPMTNKNFDLVDINPPKHSFKQSISI